ncbi:MAG: tetratricopeptide repeat protein [Candidatus Methanofastidiosia archaeon]
MIVDHVLGLIEKGDNFLKKGDCEKALNHYEEAITAEYECAEAWYKKGNVLRRINENQEALEAYEQAITINPALAKAWLEKGNILSYLKKYDEALQAYKKVTDIKGEDTEYVDASIEKGNILSCFREHKEALQVYNKSIEIFEDLQENMKNDEIMLKFAEVFYKKGNALGTLNEDKEALEAFEKALELCRKVIDGKQVLDKKNAVESQCEIYEKAVSKYKSLLKHPENWCERGRILYDLERYDHAVEAYEKAAVENNIEAHYGKGRAFYSLGRYREAVKACQKAIEIFESLETSKKTDNIKECADAWYTIGSALDDLKEHKKALRAYERAIGLDPRDVRFWNNKGVTLYNLGEYKKALKAYERAIALDPKKATVWSGKGAILYNLKRYEEASKAYEIAINLNRNYATPYANLGEILLIHGDIEGASHNIDKAYILDESYFFTLLMKGRIEVEKRRYDCALRFFEKAAHFGLGNPLPLLWIAHVKYLKAETCFKPEDGRYKEMMFSVIRDLEKAYDLSKDHPRKELSTCILYNLGYFYFRNGDIFAAKERLEECVKLESAVKKLERVFGSKSYSKPRTRDLLNYVWDCKIKPTWWRWWLFSPTWCWPKRILFFLFLLPIPLLLLFHPLISKHVPFVQVGWPIYSSVVLLLILILVSPNVEKITVKEIEMKVQSPPVFETFLPPWIKSKNE